MRLRTPLRLAVASLVVGLATVAVVPVAGASSHTVTTCSGSGPGSLPAVISAAAPGATIKFRVTCPPGSPIVLSSTINIPASLTIRGPGASKLAVSGNHAVGVFSIPTAVTANVSGITIEDGDNLVGPGGGLYNEGTVTFTHSTVTKNVDGPGQSGGGIANNGGSVIVTDSTVSDNTAGIDGGGIESSGSVTISNSTVSGNMASGNGGGFENGGTLDILNSTVADNSDTGGGGAIFTIGGSVSVTGSTISGNTNVESYGIIQDNCCSVTLQSTIVANSNSLDCEGFVSVPVTDGGYNLADDNSCRFSGTSFSDTPAGLDPAGLQNNGGKTQTIALESGSAAIGAVASAFLCSTRDQRGVKRHTPCDIGAYQTPRTHKGR